MNKQKYLDDLKDIKDIMQRSSRFLSLSGLSGIFIGIFALIATWLAYETIYENQNYLSYREAVVNRESLFILVLIATLTLVLSLSAGIFFTFLKAKKTHQQLWDNQSRRLLINLFIPLFAGGILCLILLIHGYIGLIAPLTLIFYGLALVNASNFTLPELRSLGIIEILLGLLGTQFIGFGLIFWAIGFGIMHIVYGIVMHIRHGS